MPVGKLPTGAVLSNPSVLPATFAWLISPLILASNSSPHGYSFSLVPRAENSHSASVGSRLPAQFAYRDASSKLTPTTDWVDLDEDHSRNEVWNVLSLIEKGHIVRWLLQIYQDRMHQVS